MSTFSSTEELYTVMGGFLREMAADPRLGAKLRAARVSFRVDHTDPQASILIDCHQSPPQVVMPAGERTGDVHLTMSADDGHRFWLGELAIMPALATGRITVSGQLMRMMGLLPAMDSASQRYRDYLREHGFADRHPA